MDNFVDERDYKLLENDKYTFYVLSRIIGGKCELLLTDHEQLIICYSCHPYPVWIWTADGANENDMERAYRLAQEYSLLNGKHRFNLKYDLANYFIKRATDDNKKLSIFTNMFAYDCRKLIAPTPTDGSIHLCCRKDIDELTNIIETFHNELKMDQADLNSYRLQAEEHINAGRTYFWKNNQGNNVASCYFTQNGNTASISLVFTRPEFRRKHYAENLVYQVTKIIMNEGLVPMLYTNADYIASNACYKKIGYILQGKLCTIG